MTPPKKNSEKSSRPEPWAGSAADWKKRGGPHRITLPSGQQVVARIIGIAGLGLLEGLPADLSNAVSLHVANMEHGGLPAVIGAELATVETDPAIAERLQKHISDFARLARHGAAAALVEPEMTVEELDDVPLDDLEMLMRLATGRLHLDAAGVRIGVEPIDAWAAFPHEHKCPPDCKACTNARAALSSVDVGDL